MTNQKHFITPPDDLIKQWLGEFFGRSMVDAELSDSERYIAAKSSQWGADQELEACLCEVSFLNSKALAVCVRAARRPKPPSLKEQALEALKHAPGPDYPNPITLLTADEHALIRRALEQLNDD